MKNIQINFIGSTLTVKASLIDGGHYDGKYLVFPYSFPTPIEMNDAGILLQIPDVNNFNTTGVLQVSTQELETKTLEDIIGYGRKNGIVVPDESLFLMSSSNWFIIADNLTTGSLTIYFFGQLAVTPYGKITSYNIKGNASDYIS